MHFERIVRIYLVPAGVFQSVIIGGGYGTGREVVEYLSRHGARGGLLSAAVIAIGFGTVLALSFAFAHRFALHDYRRFLRALLGRAWILYEILFVALLILVLAIVGAAAGAILEADFGVPHSAGVSTAFVAVVALNFFGRRLVERSLLAWSLLLMAGLTLLVTVVVATGMPAIAHAFTDGRAAPGAALSGFKFAVYNSALVPVLIYCAAGIETRGQALRSGAVAGVFGVVPAVALHLAFMSRYPAIVDAPVPTRVIIETVSHGSALSAYFVILFGTIVLTAAGVLQGVNERIDGWRADRGRGPATPGWHALTAGAVLAVSLVLARFGITDLVATGYGTLAWGFFLVFTLPLVTIGSYKLIKAGVRA